jgi:hypothetical protein
MKKEDIVEQLYLIEAIEGIFPALTLHPDALCIYPPLLQAIASLLQEKSKDLHFDFVYAVNAASIPLATLLSSLKKKPLCYDLSCSHSYLKPGLTCLLFDATTMHSKEELSQAYDHFSKQGIPTASALTLLSPSSPLPSTPFKLHSLWKMQELACSVFSEVQI